MGTRYVVLLRGVNVGGHHSVPMPRLRELLAAGGLADVRTHLASGNVVAGAGTVADERDAVGAAVRDVVRRGLGVDVPVVVRTGAELAALVAADPFPDADPSRTAVAFASSPLDDAAVAALRGRAASSERVEVAGGEVWLSMPDGMARTKLLTAPPPTGVVVTVRNVRTVRRLAEMAA